MTISQQQRQLEQSYEKYNRRVNSRNQESDRKCGKVVCDERQVLNPEQMTEEREYRRMKAQNSIATIKTINN